MDPESGLLRCSSESAQRVAYVPLNPISKPAHKLSRHPLFCPFLQGRRLRRAVHLSNFHPSRERLVNIVPRHPIVAAFSLRAPGQGGRTGPPDSTLAFRGIPSRRRCIVGSSKRGIPRCCKRLDTSYPEPQPFGKTVGLPALGSASSKVALVDMMGPQIPEAGPLQPGISPQPESPHHVPRPRLPAGFAPSLPSGFRSRLPVLAVRPVHRPSTSIEAACSRLVQNMPQ